jgi:DNA-binding transcriptional ArsR family regulator
MPQYSSPTRRSVELDAVFHALADPTRRAVVERLIRGPASTSELARPFGMALPSFAEHLERLERSGLVTSKKVGRVRTYHLAPRRLTAASHWLDAQRALWTTRLDQLDAAVLAMKKKG